MKLSQNIKFDPANGVFQGFVDLGDHTPERHKDQLGDHALVIMFQPFRGKWVQTLACFLSKGCADSKSLQYLILECLILLENSGFQCDAVVTDGASWNRSMWDRFGITEDQISTQHPCDESRRLWFFSDFPHLIKNFRNAIAKNEEIWVSNNYFK